MLEHLLCIGGASPDPDDTDDMRKTDADTDADTTEHHSLFPAYGLLICPACRFEVMQT
jgi:hypothetical protein